MLSIKKVNKYNTVREIQKLKNIGVILKIQNLNKMYIQVYFHEQRLSDSIEVSTSPEIRDISSPL